MFAFGFALVPLYDAFCSLTGFGGKTAGVASAAQLDVKPDPSRTVRVEFVASLPRGAPWEFGPNETHLDVHPGELYVTHFHATEPHRPRARRAGRAEHRAGHRGSPLPQDRVLLLHAAGVRAARKPRPQGRVHGRARFAGATSTRSSLSYTFFTAPQ